MSYAHTPVQETMGLVERARGELDKFKSHISQLAQSEGKNSNNNESTYISPTLLKQIGQAEAMVEKAEKTTTRIKTMSRVPQRPTASVPASLRAKRALSVLLAGNESDNNKQQGIERNVRQKTGYLSAAGKPPATPIKDEDLGFLIKKLSKETELIIGKISTRGVRIECRNVFRAFVWFKEVIAPGGRKSTPPTTVPGQGGSQKQKQKQKPSAYVIPEHIGCFRVDESRFTKWACSEHAIFHVMTERANAAIRYFQAKEDSGEAAFVSLIYWLAKHKKMFNTKSEDRRLAFDASRGIFLPACIFSFEGNAPPRFTRGTIPRRPTNQHHSSRVGTNTSQQGQLQQQSQKQQQILAQQRVANRIVQQAPIPQQQQQQQQLQNGNNMGVNEMARMQQQMRKRN